MVMVLWHEQLSRDGEAFAPVMRGFEFGPCQLRRSRSSPTAAIISHSHAIVSAFACSLARVEVDAVVWIGSSDVGTRFCS